MELPVMPPVSPMLSKPVREIPPGMSYEPKWDGFRTICFRDGDEVEFGSRNERPMTRYFPELVAAARAELPQRCVVDGEIVIATGTGLDFEALQLRLHPAASRVTMLAEQTPAAFIAFDLLALGDDDLTGRAFSERRAALVDALGPGPSFHVTPATTDIATAQRWFDEFEGAGLDGVIAKRLDGPYLPGKREMVKVKHHRDADCVAMGYRIHKSGEGVGSILLGLYRPDGELQMVGGAASFTAKDRLKLLAELEPLRLGDEVREGDPSRWNSAADKRWIPVRPERVCEVAYDQMEGNTVAGRRFRHAVRFLRWRPDREPSSCTFDQLDTPLDYDLYDVLETR
ncbi:ATP-dependent DNA ligase [Mycobacterium sp. GA-1841]|uniref:ATP-dependent DNA ligase n=2 Tax=Mycobacterium sp. GA-1841 TaxID=1834154 RepID=UPI00096EAFFC|nr:ATP-dependent DNA ligase [Mycobacterium sp. GA-1841]OMC38437.1 ATP-dependent DNA ligase [Mycobacterium sp. GA-1841]